jgi:HlyD family secretion protein
MIRMSRRAGFTPRVASAPLLVLACFALLTACSSNKATESATEETIAPVEVTAAKTASIGDIVTAEAIVYPAQQANIMPKISAPVVRYYTQRGDHVRQGELLAVLDNKDLAAAARESEELYKQAEANYDIVQSSTVPEDAVKAKTDVESARQALDAARQVYESRVKLLQEGAIAEQLVQQAKVALVQAQAAFDAAQTHLQTLETVGHQQLAGAKAQMQAAKAHYEGAVAQVDYSEVRSPINGLIADRPVYVGEMASSGSALFTIVDISKVIARASVPVQEATAMQVGQSATISGPGIALEGKVIVVSPAVDPSTTTVEVWVEAPNPGERSKPGTTAHVSVNTGEIKNAVVVPAAALLSSDEGGDKVMIAGADGRAHESKVQTGIRNGDRIQIIGGVKPGDQVITEGALGLEDGARIKVVAAGNPAAAKADS